MTIRYEEEAAPDFGFDPEEIAEQVIREALSEEDFPYEAEIGLTIVDDPMIRELNRTYRKIDKATDVLSFPLISYPAPGDFSEIEKDPYNFSPETGEALLGDIVISKDHVKAQAEEYGHSMKREFAFLTAHSMLHLLGYDHIEEKERIMMEALQEKILKHLGITREKGEEEP